MAGSSAAKSNDINKAKAIAGRLSYLRQHKFELEGFGFHDKPSINEARSMAQRNLVRMAGSARAGSFKTPSVSA